MSALCCSLICRINAGNLFRYIPSEHSSYYDNSGSYYNLMTESKHNVEEPRVVEKQIEQLLEEEVCNYKQTHSKLECKYKLYR